MRTSMVNSLLSVLLFPTRPIQTHNQYPSYKPNGNVQLGKTSAWNVVQLAFRTRTPGLAKFLFDDLTINVCF